MSSFYLFHSASAAVRKANGCDLMSSFYLFHSVAVAQVIEQKL